MIIRDIVTYLQEQGIGTFGTDIFISELPNDKTDIIALMTSPSPDPDKSVPYYIQTIDIHARFKTYVDGYSKLSDIMTLLHRKYDYELENYHVYLSYSLGMINDNDRDSQRRHLFQLTMAFIYRASDNSS